MCSAVYGCSRYWYKQFAQMASCDLNHFVLVHGSIVMKDKGSHVLCFRLALSVRGVYMYRHSIYFGRYKLLTPKRDETSNICWE